MGGTFEHLKVWGGKGLKECRLLDLGRVNVVCGRNNSGKSTLLEAIDRPEQRALGGKLGEDGVRLIRERSLERMGWQGVSSGSVPVLNARYLKLLYELVGEEVWFAREGAAFASEARERCEGDELLRQQRFDYVAVARTYEELLSDSNTTVLLPPKRSLQLNTPIATSGDVEPDGQGVTNRLFYSKNCPEGSEEWSFYTTVCDAFRYVSAGYDLGLFAEQDNVLSLHFAHGDRSWIPAKDSGLGLQDLLVILYFALAPDYDVVLVEEPESHMHPEMQRRLMHYLRSDTQKQYFLTTHSNVVLNSMVVDRVLFTRYDGSVKVDDVTSRALVLRDLGYDVTDNLVSDLVILVEGPSDVPVLEEFLAKLGVPGRYNVKVWFLGGDTMDRQNLSVLAESHRLTALIDKDPGSGRVRQRFMDNCEESGIEVRRLERYGIENYFSLRALREVFGSQIPSEVAEIDPDVKLERQIGIDVKKSNRNIAREMTLDEIEGTDLYEFLAGVEEACRQQEAGS